MWSEENLILAAVILDEEERLLTNGKRRIWIRDVLKKRNVEGEYCTLYRELVEDDTKFFQYFRMSKHQFHEVLCNIEGLIQKKNTIFRESISAKEKLCVCLRFLATGDSFRAIAISYRLGHSTVSIIIKEVCDAIIETMLHKVMPKPKEDDWRRIAEEFSTIWNFPNCLGALTGKYVIISAPSKSGCQSFKQRTLTTVLLALVDAQSRFIDVDIGPYGENCDGGIFSHSKMGKEFERGNLCIPNPTKMPGTNTLAPYVVAGDEAFPLKTNLLRPYSTIQQKDDTEKKIFNSRLSHVRRCSENAFGMLTQNFLLYNRKLKSAPEYADKLILTTCILHNFVKESNSSYSENQTVNAGRDHILRNLQKQGGNAEATAFRVRDLYKQFFNSVGAVECQMNQV